MVTFATQSNLTNSQKNLSLETFYSLEDSLGKLNINQEILDQLKQNMSPESEKKIFNIIQSIDPSSVSQTQEYLQGLDPSSSRARKFLSGESNLYDLHNYQMNFEHSCKNYMQYFTNIFEEQESIKLKIQQLVYTQSKYKINTVDANIAEGLLAVIKKKLDLKIQAVQKQHSEDLVKSSIDFKSKTSLTDEERTDRTQIMQTVEGIFKGVLEQIKKDKHLSFQTSLSQLLDELPVLQNTENAQQLLTYTDNGENNMEYIVDKVNNLVKYPNTLTNFFNAGTFEKPQYKYNSTLLMDQNFDHLYIYSQYLFIQYLSALAILSLDSESNSTKGQEQNQKKLLKQIQAINNAQDIDIISIKENQMYILDIKTDLYWDDIPLPLAVNIGLAQDGSPLFYRSICKAIEFILKEANAQSNVSWFQSNFQISKENAEKLPKVQENFFKRLQHYQRQASRNSTQIDEIKLRYNSNQIVFQSTENPDELMMTTLMALYKQISIQFRIIDIKEQVTTQKYWVGDFVYPLTSMTHLGFLLRTQDDMGFILKESTTERSNGNQNISWKVGVDYFANLELSGSHDLVDHESTSEKKVETMRNLWNEYIGVHLEQNEGVYLINMEGTIWYAVIKQDNNRKGRIIKFINKTIVNGFIKDFNSIRIDYEPEEIKQNILGIELTELYKYENLQN